MRTISNNYFLWILVCTLFCNSTRAADPNEFVDFSTTDLLGRLYVSSEVSSSARSVILFLYGDNLPSLVSVLFPENRPLLK